MLRCPCGSCDWTVVHKSPIEPAEDKFKCSRCGLLFKRYDNQTENLSRPYLDSCDDRLRNSIQLQADEMLRLIWERVFQVLDATSDRFTMSGEDAGRLAQKCVDAIADEVPECLAK